MRHGTRRLFQTNAWGCACGCAVHSVVPFRVARLATRQPFEMGLLLLGSPQQRLAVAPVSLDDITGTLYCSPTLLPLLGGLASQLTHSPFISLRASFGLELLQLNVLRPDLLHTKID